MASSDHQGEEGGWGWVVAGAAFVAEAIIFGNIKALGVFAESISADFQTDLWLTGWVVSMSFAVQLLMAPLLLAPLRMFGYRPILLLAGVMATAGYVLVALASNSFVEWGIFIICFAGIGTGCFMYPLYTLLAIHFERYYPVAVLIADLGMSSGTLLYGPMVQVLLDTYGWRWAMMILAGLTFHLVPCAAVARARNVGDNPVYHRVPQSSTCASDPSVDDTVTGDEHGCKNRRPIFDFAVLADVRFALVTLAGCVIMFCFVGWAVYVVPHGIRQGLTPTQASFLPTSFGVGNIAGKLIATFLLHKKVIDARWIMCFGALLASGFFFVDPFVTSHAGLLLVTMAIGSGNAICNSSRIVVYRNMAGDDRLLSMLSWQGMFAGFSTILSGFASGWLYDVTGSFTTTFIMFGALQFLAVVCILLDICISYHKKDP